MLFLLSFVVLLGAALTGALLAIDAWSARTQAPRRMQHAHHPSGHDWSPTGSGLAVEDVDAVDAEGLPAPVRTRLWGVFGTALVVGFGLLVAAS